MTKREQKIQRKYQAQTHDRKAVPAQTWRKVFFRRFVELRQLRRDLVRVNNLHDYYQEHQTHHPAALSRWRIHFGDYEKWRKQIKNDMKAILLIAQSEKSRFCHLPGTV